MDKSWIMKPQNSIEYEQGVRQFIDFALEHNFANGKLICPCKRCGFKKWHCRDVVYDHLICTPFPKGYTCWVHHGEMRIGETSYSSHNRMPNEVHENVVENPIESMINDAFGVDMHHAHEVPIASNLDVHLDDVMPHTTQEEHESREYYELARDGQEPLYEGCIKYSRLSFLVKLYHIKCLCGISDKAMTMILELLNDAFENVKIPCSFYEAKKIITKLGLNYEKIHACPNNCMLYWGNREDEEREACKTCHTSRWKSREKVGMVEVTSEDNNLKKIPAKVLRYFPLKPRLQRLFLSSKSAKDMIWHAVDSNNDGMLRHPRDSEAWKHFNLTHKEFASDPRNVRLALATDGFNPFGLMSPNYSIRPVILIPYNMPPWLCMKPTSFIMSMIIPGKKMPGNDIDVYLQPLIKELNELWTTSVDAYDSFKKEMFKLRAALMWTISDFPGLGTLSGWNTYTGLACPSCNFDFAPLHLKDSGKFCFWGFRRYLDQRHRFRLCIIRFNGEQDMCNPPKRLSGVEILQQVENVKVVFGREKKKDSRKRKRSERFAQRVTEQWHKKSIFFDLIYWKQNCLRHCLDVMHIEKNVCDNIINTLLNVPKKSKDHVDARKDLKVLGIRPDLWPNENGRYPQAIFTLSSKDMLPSRQVASRSRSMPNPQNAPSASHQNARVHQQSEPIPNVESSQEEVQAGTNETENVPDNPLVVQRRTSPYWTVDVIDGEGHISQTRLRMQDVFAMTDSPTKILTQWNRHNQPVGDSSSLLVGFLGQVASNFGNFPVLYENWA
ncbi:uncharacterized protein LOC114915544 [Cajanus cajan]|uniref:uncharacterized protein LOC114915544 n=1 Tax=Cajanus cajan TaxID=3821 RepID=UPI0010FB705A|nr:uncharacterized protein LOC114915544 [Cajanus cajan]